MSGEGHRTTPQVFNWLPFRDTYNVKLAHTLSKVIYASSTVRQITYCVLDKKIKTPKGGRKIFELLFLEEEKILSCKLCFVGWLNAACKSVFFV